jgi:hypothetical protein
VERGPSANELRVPEEDQLILKVRLGYLLAKQMRIFENKPFVGCVLREAMLVKYSQPSLEVSINCMKIMEYLVISHEICKRFRGPKLE